MAVLGVSFIRDLLVRMLTNRLEVRIWHELGKSKTSTDLGSAGLCDI